MQCRFRGRDDDVTIKTAKKKAGSQYRQPDIDIAKKLSSQYRQIKLRNCSSEIAKWTSVLIQSNVLIIKEEKIQKYQPDGQSGYWNWRAQ